MGKKKIIEGRWSCFHCGSNDILGRHQVCPNCGRQRDKNFKPQLPDDIKSNYVSEEEAKKISRNPDWLCSYCQSYNSDNSTTCIGCGAPKAESEGNYFENQKKEMKKHSSTSNLETSSNNTANDNVYNEYPVYLNGIDISKKEKTSSFSLSSIKPILSSVLVILCIILCTLGLIHLFSPKEITMNVTEHSWSRSISIEEFKTVQENGWYLPSKARLLYMREEFYTTERVLDHYETKSREVEKERIVGYDTYTTITDLGNGYFEEEEHSVPIYETYTETEYYEEPVYKYVDIYKTKYYYEIDKWVYCRSIKTSGSDKSPYWGNLNLNSKERESSRSETYTITGIVDGKTDTLKFSFDDWNSIKTGEIVKLKVSFGFGEIVEKE